MTSLQQPDGGQEAISGTDCLANLCFPLCQSVNLYLHILELLDCLLGFKNTFRVYGSIVLLSVTVSGSIFYKREHIHFLSMLSKIFPNVFLHQFFQTYYFTCCKSTMKHTTCFPSVTIPVLSYYSSYKSLCHRSNALTVTWVGRSDGEKRIFLEQYNCCLINIIFNIHLYHSVSQEKIHLLNTAHCLFVKTLILWVDAVYWQVFLLFCFLLFSTSLFYLSCVHQKCVALMPWLKTF